MNLPKPSRPALLSAAAGAAFLALNGFTWGGWVTGDTARDMAQQAVVEALLPICIEQSSRDPDLAYELRRLENAQSYMRPDMVAEAGWATMPGADAPHPRVAAACGETLVAKH